MAEKDKILHCLLSYFWRIRQSQRKCRWSPRSSF